MGGRGGRLRGIGRDRDEQLRVNRAVRVLVIDGGTRGRLVVRMKVRVDRAALMMIRLVLVRMDVQQRCAECHQRHHERKTRGSHPPDHGGDCRTVVCSRKCLISPDSQACGSSHSP